MLRSLAVLASINAASSVIIDAIVPWHHEHKCLDLVDGDTTNGNKLMIWDCNQGPTQRWSLVGDQIVYKSDPSKCVDILNANNGEDRNGYALQIWDCHERGHVGVEQQWHYEAADSSIRLTSSGGKKCIDLLDHKTDNGSPVALWDCNGGPQQKWALGEHLPWLQNNDMPFIVAIVILSIVLVASLGCNCYQGCASAKSAKSPALNDPSNFPQQGKTEEMS